MKTLLLALLLTACSSRAVEPAPYANPSAGPACEARAQLASACPDLKAEPCEGFWDAYDVCMIAAE